MKRIRNNVFETNSSSSHTLSINDDRLVPSTLEIVVDELTEWEEGILIDTVGFCGFYDHNSQADKLAYIMQQLVYINGFGEIFWCAESEERDKLLEEFYHCDNFRELEEEICEYTGAKKLRFGDLDGYIDHDSVIYEIYELKEEICTDDYVSFVFAADSNVHFEFNG